jgi:hypothetical protein
MNPVDEMDVPEGFPNRETYGLLQSVIDNEYLSRIIYRWVDFDYVTSIEIPKLLDTLQSLANLGGKVDAKASPAWQMSIAMGAAADCFAKVDNAFVADWLNQQFDKGAL